MDLYQLEVVAPPDALVKLALGLLLFVALVTAMASFWEHRK